MTKAHGMIVSVGTTEGPVLASLVSNRPGRVLFVVSADTRATVEERVLPNLPAGYVPDHEILVLTDPQAISPSFGEIRAHAAEWMLRAGLDPAADVALDVTGGTKAMSVALALAGVDRGVNSFIYVGGGTRDQATGRVITGHEEVVIDVNPLAGGS